MLLMGHCGGIAVSCDCALGDFQTSLPGGLTVQTGDFHTPGVPGLHLCSSTEFFLQQAEAGLAAWAQCGLIGSLW